MAPFQTAVKQMGGKIDDQLMSAWTEVLFDSPNTAYILGRAVMAEIAGKGVVDCNGEIHGHPNLCVVDGSSVTANIGVNLSLTITALPEYIMAQVPDKSNV